MTGVYWRNNINFDVKLEITAIFSRNNLNFDAKLEIKHNVGFATLNSNSVGLATRIIALFRTERSSILVSRLESNSGQKTESNYVRRRILVYP